MLIESDALKMHKPLTVSFTITYLLITVSNRFHIASVADGIMGLLNHADIWKAQQQDVNFNVIDDRHGNIQHSFVFTTDQHANGKSL